MVTFVEMVESLDLMFSGDRDTLKGLVRLALYPLGYLDPFLVRLPLAHSVANGCYFIGQGA